MPKGEKLHKVRAKTQFTSKNQPSGESKSKGQQKATLLRDIASQIVKGGVRDTLVPLANFLGVDIDKIDLEMVMHLKQMEKAIKEGDTQAYNSIMNRILGKPKEFVEINDVTQNKPPSMLEFKDYGDK